MENEKAYDLEERLIAFAVRILELVRSMPKDIVGSHMAGQVVKCGTSTTLHYGEAQSAESMADFIHKMKVCLKELRETRICLLLIQRSNLVGSPKRLDALLEECIELIRIFKASVDTAEKNQVTPGRRKP